jgi:putative oxidoreductase
MKRLITLDFLPHSYDLALLLLRVWAGFSLFLKHGVEKIAHFSGMAAHFPDPVHIGSHWSLMMALLSDAVCSLLIILGLATRWAALYIAVILGTAFTLFHHFALSGPRSGELPYLYLGIALTIFFAGPGRFSMDGTRGKTLKTR